MLAQKMTGEARGFVEDHLSSQMPSGQGEKMASFRLVEFQQEAVPKVVQKGGRIHWLQLGLCRPAN